MARKKNENKSQQIRERLEKDPDAKASQIASELGVATSLVYSVKSKLSKGGTTKPKRGRPPKSRTASKAKVTSSGGEFDAICTAAQLVERCGSIEAARKAIDTVESVTRIVN